MNFGVIDFVVVGLYLLVLVLITVFQMRRTHSTGAFFVGDGNMRPTHVGLSIAATDVGGGFSIGLGGLAFVIGISASWLLFTGLIGAMLAAVLIIPQVKKFQKKENFLTYPDLFRFRFGASVAMAAAVVSLIGYTGFTGSQLLAGAKLTRAVFPALSHSAILVGMAFFVIAGTAFGGIRAVVATDTFQWSVLCGGLLFAVLPVTLYAVGGLRGLEATLPAEFFSLTNIDFVQAFNWIVTIVPIWFVAMTLYQRMYAIKGEQQAKRAWYIAGFFEWPVMAFTGAFLGVVARAAYAQGLLEGGASAVLDPEMGILLMIKSLVPSGLMGLVLMAYLSAVLSTADSCLLAASGHLVGDFGNRAKGLRYARWATALVGAFALLIALAFDEVLQLMLLSYSVMVAGLLVPTCYALFSSDTQKLDSRSALISMFTGGVAVLAMNIANFSPAKIDPTILAIVISWLGYRLGMFFKDRIRTKEIR